MSNNSPTGANVCNTQDSFNVAFNKALKATAEDDMKKSKPWMYVYVVLWLTFFIWALVLAMQVAQGPNRLIHLVFAMVFSPVYVLSYYIGVLGDKSSASMSFGRFYN